MCISSCVHVYSRDNLGYNFPPHKQGCGDFALNSVSTLPDPCPLPDKLKKRSLNEKEKLIYAPMTGVGGIVYDKVQLVSWFISADL